MFHFKAPHDLFTYAKRYDDPAYRDAVPRLKAHLAALRARIGDTDQAYPKVRAIVEEFWDYDEEARQKAIQISHDCAAPERAAAALAPE